MSFDETVAAYMPASYPVAVKTSGGFKRLWRRTIHLVVTNEAESMSNGVRALRMRPHDPPAAPLIDATGREDDERIADVSEATRESDLLEIAHVLPLLAREPFAPRARSLRDGVVDERPDSRHDHLLPRRLRRFRTPLIPVDYLNAHASLPKMMRNKMIPTKTHIHPGTFISTPPLSSR